MPPPPLPVPFFTLKAYADDTKASTIATVNDIQAVTRQMALMAPYSYTITALLTDKASRNILKGHYIELTIGKDSPHTHTWCAGYIQSVAKDPTRANAYTIQAASASLYLAHQTVGSPMYTRPSIHANLIDFLNGVQHPPASGAYPPPYRGAFTGMGVTAEWLDPNGSSPPGVGDVWHYDWATPLDILNWFCQHYNCYWREKIGRTNLQRDCIIEVGPLNDDSGLDIWGGDALKTQLQADYATYASSGLDKPNAALAQLDALAQIQAASYTDDLSRPVSMVFPMGAGTTADDGVNIYTLVGGEPLNSGGSLINSWTGWQPYTGGKQYYVKAGSRVTYQGNTFEFIAHETNASAPSQRRFNYGVVNRQGVTSGPDPFKVKELFLPETAIRDPSALLSAGIGRLEYLSQPVKSYSFAVLHPLTSATGVPSFPAPGQRVTVHYEGAVHQAMAVDANASSPTYGQIIGVGAYTYLKFPTVASPTDEDGATYSTTDIHKMSRVISMTDTWGGHEYMQTLALGRGKFNFKQQRDDLAKRMERNLRRKPQTKKHSFKWEPFEGVGFVMNSLAEEDEAGKLVTFSPGGLMISDVADSNFFNDNRAVSFTFTVTDAAGYLWFIFDKKVDSLIKSLNSSQTYRVLQLAFSGTSLASRLYSASTSGVLTAKGTVHRSELLNSNKRLATGTLRVTVRERGGRIEATLMGQDASLPAGIQTERVIATWLDTNLSNWGAIGFYYDGGSANATISALHAHAHHHQQPAKQSVFPSHNAPTNQNGHRRQPTGSGGWGYSISHEQPN